MLATALTRAGARELLDVSRQTVLERLAAGDIVGVKKGREWRLPLCQFDADLAAGVVPGLREVAAAFGGGVASSIGCRRDAPEMSDAVWHFGSLGRFCNSLLRKSVGTRHAPYQAAGGQYPPVRSVLKKPRRRSPNPAACSSSRPQR